ncbi:protein phosphatase 2C domain-containing protein [Streptomyces gamaensis]|uniref:Protein phosphatase 2C domain-containing protein n=1 Tax=Streptomyces gamaensis TaxID=1763542 RepID=A0ABW0YUE8_9ACTN
MTPSPPASRESAGIRPAPGPRPSSELEPAVDVRLSAEARSPDRGRPSTELRPSAGARPSVEVEPSGGARFVPLPRQRGRAVDFVGERPPTYDPEPTAWPDADPGELGDSVPDTVLDGAQYGAVTLRALSLRGDSARYRGEPRRDALLTARFGEGESALLFVAMAGGTRAAEGAHRAARDVCAWLGGAVGRSHARLADDIRGGRRGELRAGLQRLTDRSYGRLRARAAELGLRPEEYTAAVRALLLTADPRCRTRVCFGAGTGGLFRLREGVWDDLDQEAESRVVNGAGVPVVGYGPVPPDPAAPGGAPAFPAPGRPGEGFRFLVSAARPGDTLLLCTAGLAEPLRDEPELGDRLAERWSGGPPPGLAAFLADAQLRVKGYADDRTACALWEG